jgi:hypothetical protein
MNTTLTISYCECYAVNFPHRATPHGVAWLFEENLADGSLSLRAETVLYPRVSYRLRDLTSIFAFGDRLFGKVRIRPEEKS